MSATELPGLTGAPPGSPVIDHQAGEALRNQVESALSP